MYILDEILNITKDSILYENIKDRAYDTSIIDEFILEGRPIKSKNIINNTKHCYDFVLDLGGYICGGAAFAKFFGLNKSKDIDVFFNDRIKFAIAFFETWKNPIFDICFYNYEPLESFDLAIAKVGFSKNSFIISPEAEEAIVTGISDIYINNLICPSSTFKRMIKYHMRCGVKYRADKSTLILAKSGLKWDDVKSDYFRIII